MKIAYISYEYPPDTAVGGIATYTYQASKVMQSIGHHVEVFCATAQKSASVITEGIWVHKVNCTDRQKFSQFVVAIFSERHSITGFDIIETAEFNADAAEIHKKFPAIALIVKLHSPSFMLKRVSLSHLGFNYKVKYILKGLRKGVLPKPFWKYNKQNDTEYQLARKATKIFVPSTNVKALAVKEWKLHTSKIALIPNIYVPNESLLQIPVQTNTRKVVFIGRLEVLKGIFDLCEAIPIVLQKHSDVVFNLVGKAEKIPMWPKYMDTYVLEKLKDYKKNIHLLGPQHFNKIPDILAEADICVIPSLWESFSYVCLEAMSAGRGVVSSRVGGMVEMLDENKAGILVPPGRPNDLAQAIISLLDNPALRYQAGTIARKRVIDIFNTEKIGKLMEHHYLEAIRIKKRHNE